MKYRLRLNEDPELEVGVNHIEEINDDNVIIDDTGNFDTPQKDIIITKFELIGDDGEIYAMRKLPPNLPVLYTTTMKMETKFKLTLKRSLVSNIDPIIK